MEVSMVRIFKKILAVYLEQVAKYGPVYGPY